ncbi:unnamed protein product [Dovyalis caffra]|uniref:Uncharacterized protein n=1 Tax=Dovyalis caffra TaxID=77055 RepID=A0AAV1RSE6_9ROSI|nr:unnamed protein product [Dovyalis caffra]
MGDRGGVDCRDSLDWGSRATMSGLIAKSLGASDAIHDNYEIKAGRNTEQLE